MTGKSIVIAELVRQGLIVSLSANNQIRGKELDFVAVDDFEQYLRSGKSTKDFNEYSIKQCTGVAIVVGDGTTIRRDVASMLDHLADSEVIRMGIDFCNEMQNKPGPNPETKAYDYQRHNKQRCRR